MLTVTARAASLLSVYFAIAFALASTSALAGDGAPFFVKSLTTLESTAGGEAIATLNPATPLIVHDRKGGYVQVEVKGWSPAGGDKYLFKEPGIRINLGILSDAGVKARVVGETQEDDYGSEWTAADITGWVAEKDVAPGRDGVWKDASDIYFSHCTRCHSLHRPREFAANQWPQALRVMTVRAGLTKEQAALVTMLLQYHAKDQNLKDAFTEEADTKTATAPTPAAKTEGTPEMAKKGAELFKSSNCFACHGEDARTPVAPEYPKLAGQNAEYIFKQIEDFKTGVRANDTTASMKDTVTPLSDDDARTIAYWLSTQ